MIQADKGEVKFEGKGEEIHADIVCIIFGLFKILREKFGTKIAFEAVEKTICKALEEINKLIKEGEKDGD